MVGSFKNQVQLHPKESGVHNHLERENSSSLENDLNPKTEPNYQHREEARRILNRLGEEELERTLKILGVSKSDPIRLLEVEFGKDLKAYRDRGIERRHFVVPAIKIFHSIDNCYALDQGNSHPLMKYPLAINCPGYDEGIREFLDSLSEENQVLAKLKQTDPVGYMFNAIERGDNVDKYLVVLEACPRVEVRRKLSEILKERGDK